MKEEILKKVDHTLLKQTSTWEDIKKLCDDAIKCNTASVCIPPCFVKQAKSPCLYSKSRTAFLISGDRSNGTVSLFITPTYSPTVIKE